MKNLMTIEKYCKDCNIPLVKVHGHTVRCTECQNNHVAKVNAKYAKLAIEKRGILKKKIISKIESFDKVFTRTNDNRLFDILFMLVTKRTVVYTMLRKIGVKLQYKKKKIKRIDDKTVSLNVVIMSLSQLEDVLECTWNRYKKNGSYVHLNNYKIQLDKYNYIKENIGV